MRMLVSTGARAMQPKRMCAVYVLLHVYQPCFIYLFIYLNLFMYFLAALGLRCCMWAFLVAVSGGYSLLWCTGFLLWWLLLLRSTGSRCMGFSSCGSWALERRLSSCGTWAYLLHSMWDLPGPGLKPVSPALAGGFLATVPPGKSLSVFHFEYLAFLLLPDFLPQITIT